MGRVVHFELFSGEPSALVDFYRTAFGWEITDWQGDFEYHMASTGAEGTIGINGAIAPNGAAGNQPVVLTLGVDDIDAAAAAVLAAGGSAVTEKNTIPGVGLQQYFKDPSGAVFGVLQPDMSGMQAPAASAACAEGTADQWTEVGDRLKEIGVTIGQVVQDAADSPQGKQLREQAEKAAGAIGEASRTAADKARPHVITALDRVSIELGELAAKLRAGRQADAEAAAAESAPESPAEAPEGTSGDGTSEE
jgi:uncharacterized protein